MGQTDPAVAIFVETTIRTCNGNLKGKPGLYIHLYMVIALFLLTTDHLIFQGVKNCQGDVRANGLSMLIYQK